jgi:hypothetical protein
MATGDRFFPKTTSLRGNARYEKADEFGEVSRTYIRYCPKLESTIRPPHQVVALA